MSRKDLINRWRKTTQHFNSDALWKKRLKILGITSEHDLDSFIKKKKNFKYKTADTLSFLLRNKKSILLSDRYSYITQRVVFELEKYTLRSIEFLKKQKKISHDVIENLHQIVDKLICSTVEFEYKVFCKAFPETKTDYSTFLRLTTRRKDWLEYFTSTYPLLCVDIDQFIIRYKHHIDLFAKRLSQDFEIIEGQILSGDSIQEIVSISPICSDFHKGGLSTISVTVMGQKKNVYIFFYKPKSLSPDLFWNHMVKQFSGWGLCQSILYIDNIDRGDYGWQKGIKPDLFLKDQAQIDRFYFNQGINIGLAFFLNTQDLIADNIITHKEYPAFFDLEMTFCPTPKPTGDYITGSKSGRDYLQSIIKTGLVPCFGFETLNSVGVNNSGLSYSGKYNMPNTALRFIHTQKILQGFQHACSFFLQNKTRIIHFFYENIYTISRLQSRYLIRYTFNYDQVLKSTYSPDNQSDAFERHLTIEHLWRGFDDVLLNEKIIQEEIDQITEGDIPYFVSYANSKDLFNHRGKVIVKSYFQASGFDTIIEKIKNFSPETQRLQENILNRSLYIHGFIKKSDVFLQDIISIQSKYKSYSLIDQIAKALTSLNDPKEDKYFTYIDYVISKEDVWDQGLQNLDLFQGTGGVGIFFMAYYKLSKDNMALDIVHRIFYQSLEYIEKNRENILDSCYVKLGVMNFPISFLLYYIYGKRILDKDFPDIDSNILDFILLYIEKKYTHDTFFDYFSGAAGLILVLIEFSKVNPHKKINELVTLLGSFLIKSSVNISKGLITWEKKTFNMWGGFAHGNSGISYALFKLSDFSQKECFFDAGVKALKYDQFLFDEKERIWKKTLYEKGDIHHSWGNGTAGIALSRLLISPMYHNNMMNREIQTALQIMKNEIQNRSYTDHSIASGLLGLLEIYELLGNTKFPKEFLVKSFLNRTELCDLTCGGWEQNPIVTGLYYGYAGIGYNLIKLIHINSLPSLLWI